MLVGIDLVLSVGIDDQALYRRSGNRNEPGKTIAKNYRDLKTASPAIFNFWQSLAVLAISL